MADYDATDNYDLPFPLETANLTFRETSSG